MLSIDWRSPAAYRHTMKIPAAGFAWEYLRRNHDYRQEFRTLARTGGLNDSDLEAFMARWGLRFPCDPDAPHDRQLPIWSPRLQPQAVRLLPVEDHDTEPIVTLAHLDGLDLRHAADAWHGLWEMGGVAHQLGGVAHQFWLSEAVPDVAALYSVSLPMDSFLELRAHAARRLWRSLNGRAPGPDFRAVPTQLRQWHTRTSGSRPSAH